MPNPDFGQTWKAKGPFGHETGDPHPIDDRRLRPRPIARDQTATAPRRTAAGVACVVALLMMTSPASATDAGQVLTYNGDCYVVADGKRAKLNMGDVVHVGDVLEVPDDAKLKLQMTDGSVLSL